MIPPDARKAAAHARRAFRLNLNFVFSIACVSCLSFVLRGGKHFFGELTILFRAVDCDESFFEPVGNASGGAGSTKRVEDDSVFRACCQNAILDQLFRKNGEMGFATLR